MEADWEAVDRWLSFFQKTNPGDDDMTKFTALDLDRIFHALSYTREQFGPESITGQGAGETAEKVARMILGLEATGAQVANYDAYIAEPMPVHGMELEMGA